MPSWKIRRISRRFLCVFSPQSIIPRTRTSLIEWPAVLKCSAMGKPGKFFSMLQRCLPKCCLRSFVHHYFLFFIEHCRTYFLKCHTAYQNFFSPVICLKSWIHVHTLLSLSFLIIIIKNDKERNLCHIHFKAVWYMHAVMAGFWLVKVMKTFILK